MSKRTAKPDVIAPITPQAAAESALENLIYNTYSDLKLIERRRDQGLQGIQNNAAYLSKRYAEMAERASEGASPSNFDGSFFGSISERLAEASNDYRTQTNLLAEQRRLLKRLLACTTAPQLDQIVYAASL